MDADRLQQLARLARLRLTPEETEQARQRLERLLEYFAVLDGVNTDGIEASPYPLQIPHRLRADDPGEVLSQEQALQNAPAVQADSFLVPRVVEG